MERPDTGNDLRSAPLIAYYCITGSLIYLGSNHSVKVLKVICQCICLLIAHSLLIKMDTDPASYLVFNSEFQSSSNLYSAVSSVSASAAHTGTTIELTIAATQKPAINFFQFFIFFTTLL